MAGAGKSSGRHWGDEEGQCDCGWEGRGVSGKGEQRSREAAFSVCFVNEKNWCPLVLEAPGMDWPNNLSTLKKTRGSFCSVNMDSHCWPKMGLSYLMFCSVTKIWYGFTISC